VNDEADNCTVNPVVAFVGDLSDGNTCRKPLPGLILSLMIVVIPSTLRKQLLLMTQQIRLASNPAGVTVQCIAQVPVSNPAVVIDEADNCAVPTVAFVSDVSDGNTCPETITRTYSVTDACGNSINVTQTIIVDDTTNPTASNPLQ